MANAFSPVSKTISSHTHKLDWLDQVKQKVRDIRFGEIIITIHDGQVVQLAVHEKTRLVGTQNTHRP